MLVWQKEKLPEVVSEVLEELVPGVFSMSEGDQVAVWREFKLKRSEEVDAALRQKIGAPKPVRYLSGEKDLTTLEQQYALNSYELHIFGHGPDRVYINESGYDQERTECDFGSLLDYSKFYHECQQKYLEEECEKNPEFALENRPFRAVLYGDWFRCLDNGELTYLNVYTAAEYLSGKLEDAAFELVDELIPCSVEVAGEEIEIAGKKFREFEMVEDAGGLEKERVALFQLARCYCKGVEDSLHEDFSAAPASISWLDDEWAEKDVPEEKNKILILKNAEAMKRVRFDSFMSDIRDGQKEEIDFHEYAERLREALRGYLEAKYRELMASRGASE